MVQRSPQEKKRLSYLKDRRNWYGENDKSSRRNIRRNKQAVNSANRRAPRVGLAVLRGPAEPELAAAVAERLAGVRPQTWRKQPDIPLGRYVTGRLERRVRLGIVTEAAAARPTARAGRGRRRGWVPGG
ncbi:hypothetical protein [Kitasatospora sp. NPDC002040]|uniref:hypothetical protein n=1 Tax=Kitasatospora sp. NPDC002040 TaxID=3154661 RepID=UPI0033320173